MKKIFSVMILFLVLSCAGKSGNVKVNEKSTLAESHFKMGLAYLNTDKDYLAVGEFEKAISINPSDDRFYYALATFYIKKNRIPDAKSNILKALKLNPIESEYINTFASILASEGNLEDAIKQWKVVLNDPGYPSASLVNYNIGLALYNLKRYEEAASYLEVTVKTNPKVIAPTLLLFRSYVYSGKLDDAERVIINSLIINPDSLELKMEAGKFYYEVGKYPEAAKYFSEVTEAKNNLKFYEEAKSYLKKMGIYNE